ncbi:MAG TPA: hypothetical protein VJN96_14945 [Vicinamibacterales bacterium]|nr:hypothetical protein [Vicinamibacterales bacterium]
MRPRARAAVVALAVLAGLPSIASGQSQEAAPAPRRVTAGGEINLVAGPADDEAFFNYTDYEHNALRIARLRLMGEWRLASRLSILGEARTENGDGVQVPALYARWQPWARHDVTIQAGVIPPVIGAFPRRAYGRDNVVIGSPLAYQYLTSLRPDALPATVDDLLRMRGRGWQPSYPVGSKSITTGVPLIATSRWDTGVETAWRHGLVELAGAVTLGAPATPVVRDPSDGLQYSGRIAVWLPGATTIGVSGARGAWINRSVLNLYPEAVHDRKHENVVGVDAETGVGPWLLRAEWVHATFEVPWLVTPAPDHLSTDSAFAEARYRFLARWQVAARVEHLGFSEVTGTLNNGLPTSWDAPVERVEGVLGFRVLKNLEVRGGYQYDWRDGGRVRERGYPTAFLLYWF